MKMHLRLTIVLYFIILEKYFLVLEPYFSYFSLLKTTLDQNCKTSLKNAAKKAASLLKQVFKSRP